MEVETEIELLKIITSPKKHEITFLELIKNFELILEQFDPVKNCFEIKKYFDKEIGVVTATKKLIQDKIIGEEWFENNYTKLGKQKNDFKGLYIYFHNEIPIYVGISKGVIGRTFQHIKGLNHNSASLAYSIGKLLYKIEEKEDYKKTRNEFNFKNYATRAKELLLKQKIAFIPISNNEEMYLFEIYCAMKYKCTLNKFETH